MNLVYNKLLEQRGFGIHWYKEDKIISIDFWAWEFGFCYMSEAERIAEEERWDGFLRSERYRETFAEGFTAQQYEEATKGK